MADELPLWSPWYPKFMYHQVEGSRLVQNPNERLALGDGWCDSPADVDDPPPLVALSYDELPGSEPVVAAIPPPETPVKGDPKDEYYQLNAQQVLMLIENAKTEMKGNVLTEIRSKEVGHPKPGLEGGRASVLKALDDAMKTVESVR